MQELLHVVTAYANPLRWASRLKLQLAFEQEMLDAGVNLTTVECAYGNLPFVLPANPHINRIQVRAKTLFWTKENLINIGISRLPADWKYLGWFDGDISFRKPTWASDTVHALQQYEVVQPWSTCYDLGPNDEHLATYYSFCRQFWKKKPLWASSAKFWTYENGPYNFPHCGYAWAATRQAIEWVGGLIDTSGGAADHHMALALVGQVDQTVPAGISAGYMAPLHLWQQRAVQHINRSIGYIEGGIEHTWHGRKEDRKYIDRWSILLENKFDPATDLKRNSFGVYELAGNKPQLTLDMDHYFRVRNEDANTMA